MDDNDKSRTKKKLEDRALQALGEQLVALSPEQIEKIDLEVELREALIFAGKTKKHGARRRQMQYIGTLMRHIDPEPIRRALDNIRLGDLHQARTFRKIEQWRDAIIEGNDQIIEEILNTCPDAERQRLSQLARNARKSAKTEKGVKASRVLFRYLKVVVNSA
jgi:ribosome-associated protein